MSDMDIVNYSLFSLLVSIERLFLEENSKQLLENFICHVRATEMTLIKRLN